MNEKQKKTTNQYRESYDNIFGKKPGMREGTTQLPRAAVGTKGFIMRTVNNGHFFRVYDDKGGFIDYDILHYDMEVQILEDNAVFVQTGIGNYLDYSAKVLGYVDEK